MKVVFSGAAIVEMSGHAQGSIIQKSYGGYQLRNLVQPVRKRTPATQQRRLGFNTVQKSWAGLTNEERQTWIDNAPEGVSGFNYYSSINNKLQSSGLSLINEFTAPVPNPPGENLTEFIGAFDDSSGAVYFEWLKGNYYRTIPRPPWQPAFRWTGWIPPNRYQYPRMNKKFAQDSLSTVINGYYITFYNEVWPGSAPPAEGWKMKYTETYINEDTGQLYTVGTYEVIATGLTPPPAPYQPGTSFYSSAFAISPPENVLVVELRSPSNAFDFGVWEPYFYFNGWGIAGQQATRPITTPIDNSAIQFLTSGRIILTFSEFGDYPEGPPNEGDVTKLAVGWTNVVSGIHYYETDIDIVAETNP